MCIRDRHNTDENIQLETNSKYVSSVKTVNLVKKSFTVTEIMNYLLIVELLMMNDDTRWCLIADDEKWLLKAENRRLHEAKTCKVCMDNDINTVFLPCGHLVSCDKCSPKLRNCAICRTYIRGTVRTIIR